MSKTPEEIAAEQAEADLAAKTAADADDADKGTGTGDNPSDKGGDAGDDKDKGDKPDPFADIRGKDLSADEVAKILDRLQAANGEAAANRHKLKEYERQNEDATARRIREAAEKAEQDTVAKFHPIFINSAAKSALTAAGATSGIDSLVKLMDTSKLKVQDDGTVTGVDAEVKRIKAELPALFAKEDATPKRRVPLGARADGGNNGDGASQKKTPGQLLVEQRESRRG